MRKVTYRVAGTWVQRVRTARRASDASMKGRRLDRHRGGPAHGSVPAFSVHRGCRWHRRRRHGRHQRRGQGPGLSPPAGDRARSSQGQPRAHLRLSPEGANERAARPRPARTRTASAQAQHRRLQHPVPAHGLPGRLPAQGCASSSARATRAATTPSAWGRSSRASPCARCRGSCCRCSNGAVCAVGVDGLIYGFRNNLAPGKKVGGSHERTAARLHAASRPSPARWPGAGALALPSFLVRRVRRWAPTEPAMALFLGQDQLPVPPEERQGPHLGLPVLQRRLRLQDLHVAGEGDARSRRPRTGPTPRRARRLDLTGDGHARDDGRAARTATSPSCRTRTASSTGRPLAPRRHQRADRLHHAQASADQPAPSATCYPQVRDTRAERCAG